MSAAQDNHNLSIPSKSQFKELTAWLDQYAKLRPSTTYKRWVFNYGIGEQHFLNIPPNIDTWLNRRSKEDPMAELRDLPLFEKV